MAALLPTATAWRANIHTAAAFTAVKRTDGQGLFFLSPVVGSVYGMPANATLLPGGTEEDCVERKTCFASMSAALPVGGGSNQQTNYANFDMFSETLLAGVLADEFELAIMDFRESRVAPLPRRLLLARASDTDLRWFVHGRSRDASGHDALP